MVWLLQTLWASVDLYQWSYKYVRNVARFAYMLERKNKHSKNFVVRGRLCAQPRRGWLVPSWKIRCFSRHFCCVFSLQSMIGSLSNQDGDNNKWICATWNFIALIPTCSIRKMLAKFFWSWILKDCIKVQEEKKKVVVLCSRPRHNVKLGTFIL